jgi:ATP-binding cassette subfamily C protein
MVAVIGPSASGKSTLVRALVGLWEPAGGTVRIDGARLDQWSSEALGRHIGYLPQEPALFAGTVRENIARFRDDATDEAVVEAAKAAHAHELIMALPSGYETEIGPYGAYLSAGQRQRVGLARALFGRPALIVLDEPNANLDRVGDEALSAAIDGMRERGQAVVLVSHRVQAIGKADDLLYIERGQQRAFGPRADVIRFLQAGMQSAGEPAATTAAPAPKAK